ncbi:MAG: ATP-binding protein [Bacteroidales bacterium]|nr:ATP-binding protein [Bacteroidales bacterium]
METLFSLQRNLLQNVSVAFVRSLMNKIDWDNNRLIGIRGPRGVGKTTLMLQHIKQRYGVATRKALYVNLDSAYFARHDLMDVVQAFHAAGGVCLLLDEVHKYPHWSQCVKNIYDMYPAMKVVFSGSSLLQILNAEADLSRRCVSYTMQGLSFREYLRFYHKVAIPAYPLETLLHDADKVCVDVLGMVRPLQYFGDYLRSGYYPFRKENPAAYDGKVENVVNMVLGIELPQLRGVDVGNVRKLKALLAVLATEVPMLVDISKLSRTTELSRVSLTAYLHHLEEAELIRLLYSDDTSVRRMQKPDKILMDNPNLCHILTLGNANEGTVRETFFCNQLAYRHAVEYTRPADFRVDGRYTFEVGGPSEDGSQVADRNDAYLACDDIEYPMGNKLPLWLFGLMY